MITTINRLFYLQEQNDRLEQVLLQCDPDTPLFWKFTRQVERNNAEIDTLRSERG